MGDFKQLLKVLNKEVPDRPVIFEFGLNVNLIKKFSGDNNCDTSYKNFAIAKAVAFEKIGFDYVIMMPGIYSMVPSHANRKKTVSLNEHSFIKDKESFDKFRWKGPDEVDYSPLEHVADMLPSGMKIIISAPGGVLENAIDLVGYDNLCYMLYDDKQLMCDIFERIGELTYRYYEKCIGHKSIGALVYNDDWGFNSHTLLPPDTLRELVFPWCRKIVKLAGDHDMPVILHSCGKFTDIIEDIIDIGFVARHSYEDKIIPVEEAYELLKGRIAVLGGIDVDYLVNETEENIYNRALKLLERTAHTGGYALGSGNSIPDYIPDKKFLTMMSAAGFNYDNYL